MWSKLALEEMDIGQVLSIVVDHADAVTSVPRSLRAEGHRTLRVVQLNETDWQIVVKKGHPPTPSDESTE